MLVKILIWLFLMLDAFMLFYVEKIISLIL